MTRRRFAAGPARTIESANLTMEKGISPGELRLQQQVGSARRAARFYRTQIVDGLNERMVEFLARLDVFFLATTDTSGGADCSIRAGMPGFVRPVRPSRLVYPEFRGNGVMASLGNITENPQLAMLFVDFEQDQIGLHINGAGSEATSADVEEYHALGIGETDVSVGRAVTWLAVDVHCAYIHCSKHIPKMLRVDRRIDWSTDSGRRKGGDYFGVAATRSEDSVW